MSAKRVNLKKISVREVAFFKIVNRQGYAAIAKNNLTEGRTVYQAYSRIVKACRRIGYELPLKTASELPRPR